MVQFLAGASPSSILTIPSFTINDDEFALESLEMYQLALTGSTFDTNVLLGPPTTVNIINEDGRPLIYFKHLNEWCYLFIYSRFCVF